MLTARSLASLVHVDNTRLNLLLHLRQPGMHVPQILFLVLIPVISHRSQLLMQGFVLRVVHLELASRVSDLWLETS